MLRSTLIKLAQKSALYAHIQGHFALAAGTLYALLMT